MLHRVAKKCKTKSSRTAGTVASWPVLSVNGKEKILCQSLHQTLVWILSSRSSAFQQSIMFLLLLLDRI